MNNQQGGLKPLKKDHRDIQLGKIMFLPRLEDLPETLGRKPFEIVDQDGNDFCAAASTGQEKALMENKSPFYPALFAIGKWLAKEDPNSWGLSMRNIYTAANYSVPMMEDAPTDLKQKLIEQDWDYLRNIENYPKDFIESGKKYKNRTYASVWHPKYDAYDTCRAALYKFREENRTIGVGVIFGWSIEDYILSGIPKKGYGHKMYILDYDEEGLIVPNSYGKKAGEGGIHRMTRETVNAFADKYGLMMGIDMDKEMAKELQKRGDWALAGLWSKILIMFRRHIS